MKTNEQEMTYSEKFGAFVEDLAFDDVPKNLTDKTKLHILDTLGVSIATYKSPYAEIMLDVCKSMGGPPESTAIGSGDRLPAPNAALVNGTMAHGLDYDDFHRAAAVHLSTFVVPTALAVSEATGTSGKNALVAAVAGYEMGARLGLAASRRFLMYGWHPTGVLGAFVSAAITGKILGMSGGQIASAIGIAGSQSSGSAQFSEEESWTKRMHPGWASHSGIIAGLFAQKGYEGPRRIFEGGKGVYFGYLGEGGFDPKKLDQGLGSTWEVEQISYKFYPAGF